MTHSRLIKGLTLLSFIFFITTFLFFRTGKFDRYLTNEKPALQTSHNGGTITIRQSDTLKPKTGYSQKLMLSSSKSLILTDKSPGLLDTPRKEISSGAVTPIIPEMMSSSKSAIIFKPTQFLKLRLDTLKYDSTKRNRTSKR